MRCTDCGQRAVRIEPIWHEDGLAAKVCGDTYQDVEMIEYDRAKRLSLRQALFLRSPWRTQSR